ncbi:MAG: ATP-binding cassette domain-containing protein, partial [Firmicutes bacterium]|nr:ATP-binding cassette domain-containing protein [Bacillota bacterium]
ILLYGHNLKEWNLQCARSYISLVSQDPYLFPTTIAENIAYGRPGASLEEIIKAAQAANAHEFIVQLPEGYNTMVGERGAKLSGGQRQRIAIARAILKDAPILLLDEPGSALDVRSETLVQDALKRLMKGRTTLVIAHKLSTILGADHVLVLNHGKIMERGTHQELIEKGGLYCELYLKQLIFQDNVNLQAAEGEA